MFVVILIFAIICLVILQWYTQRRPTNFPPGPIGIPGLGYMPFLKLPLHVGLTELAEKYGNIFSLFLANHPVVVLTGANLIKEAYKDDRITDRPPLRPFLERSWGKRRGILIGTGKAWQEHRRFTLKHMRNFGYGKGSMEPLIMDEVVELITTLKKHNGQAISLDTRLNAAVLNSLWHIISGERYPQDDPRLSRVLNTIIDSFNEVEILGPVFFMDWFTKAFPQISGWNKFMACLPPCYDLFQTYIDDHEVKLDVNNPRDLIDAYLIEIMKTTDESSSFYKEEGKKSLLVVMLDLFAAGAETTSTTITWAILYLIKYPKVQEKVQNEIDSVVGTHRLPSLADRPRMPYMESFIAETLRKSSIVPIGVVHSTTEKIEFHGYTLPKDTMIVGNFWEIHHNKKYWKNPDSFSPERFITSDGSFSKDDNVVPFSTGKRTCLGESLARDELFLFLAGFCQQFQFDIDPSQPEPTFDILLAPISRPKPYTVIIYQRIHNT